ncbi:MAG: CBS domain-containing protein [Sedimentisphaerales bacterium]|nr:CBS domain-containing protein [Sedimentisphaerales bacterium]
METRNSLIDSVNTTVVDFHSDHLITSSRAWLKVEDVMSKNVITASHDESVAKAAKTMAKNNVSCAVVTDENGIAGILTERDLFAIVTEKNKDFDKITVSQIMSHKVESISPDISVLDASAIMDARHIRRLPIIRNDRLVGIVTQTDLARALTSYGMWKDVTEIMSTNIASVQTTATVEQAAKIMKTRNISCIVVLEEKIIKGIITERDLLKRIVALKKNPAKVTADKAMTSPVITVPTSYSIFSARKIMDTMQVRRLVVMERDKLCGIITQTDIFRAVKNKFQEEEEKNMLLLENSQDRIFTLDPNGRINYANPAFMKLLEVSGPAELYNEQFLPEKFWINVEDKFWCLRELKKGNVNIKDVALKTSKNNIIYVTIFATFTKDHYGHISGIQGILYDITDRKIAEQSRAHAYDKLKKANFELKLAQSRLVQNEKLASIGQLAAGVAHEMNTPVGFVASNFQTLESYVKKIRDLLTMYDELTEQLESLQETDLKNKIENIVQYRDEAKIDFILEDIRGLFDDSREGLKRVTDIIQNLRDFSRVDQPGSRDEYDLNKGIEATLVVARNEIKYVADVKTDFSELPLIYCHPGQINQVFLNILVNAAQAIKAQKRKDKGTITIRTYPTENGVVCEISDDGPGIPHDIITRIFEPFFTTKPAGKGTGLGLSVSHDIITAKHKGELLVNSTVGRGTKFTIKLPIGTKENQEQEEKEEENSVESGCTVGIEE